MRLEKKRRTIKLMKKRGRMWGSIAFFLAAVLLAGCGQRKQKSVIGPREETTAETSEEMGEDPVTNGLESGMREACLSVTDTDCLKAQVEVPDCYEDHIIEDWMELTAHAPVLVPQVKTMPVQRFSPRIYSREEAGRLRGILGKTVGVTWEEREATGEKGLMRFQSEDHSYHLDIHPGKEGENLSILWLTNQFQSFGSSSSFDSHDLSGLDLEKEEKEKWEQHVKALGDQLVKDLGLLEGKDKSQMVLRDLQWRGIQKIGKQGEWMNDGEYGIKLFYEKQAGHVPIVHSPVGQGENGRSEYLTLSYTKEGTLLEVKHIGSMEVKGKESGEESREESGFLLPFDPIAKLAGQYFKTCYNSQESLEDLGAGVRKADVKIDEVGLEYFTYFDGSAGGGELIPVWNFYGTIEGEMDPEALLSAGKKLESRTKRGILLTIDARDGSILTSDR